MVGKIWQNRELKLAAALSMLLAGCAAPDGGLPQAVPPEGPLIETYVVLSAEGPARPDAVFDLPSIPVTMTPSKHKMALVLFVVVYTLVLLLSSLLEPFIGAFPVWAKLMVVIPIQVLLMTYLVMPRVTSLLKNWIYARP